MGQQQLLLLVLGIVIVGIAVVAGIQAFAEGKAKAEQDAAVSDAMRIISDVQAWKLKPTAFGGGSEGDWTGVTFKALGYPVDSDSDLKYMTYNGCYVMSTTTDEVTVDVFREGTATYTDPDGTQEDPVDHSDDTKTVTCTTESQVAEVIINGAGTDNIAWDYSPNA